MAKSKIEHGEIIFVEPNFKLAVIQALLHLGEFEDVVSEIEEREEFGPDGPYFQNAKGDARIGPHPEVLKRFLELPVTKKQLSRVRSLTPDGGDEIYLLIAPNWDGEDDLFALKTLKDAPLLENLEEIASFHSKAVVDCTPLLECKKLKRIVMPGVGVDFCDPATFEKLRARGVVIPDATDDSKSGDTTAFGFRDDRPRVLLLLLDEINAEELNINAFAIDKKTRNSPFYFYEDMFNDVVNLKEEEDCDKAVEEEGMRLCDEIQNQILPYGKLAGHIFKIKDDSINPVQGWAYGLKKTEVQKSFEADGFEVFSLNDYFVGLRSD
jgi:hypothetical protein